MREFPQSLRSQDALQHLYLGNNHIQGFIPQWFVDSTQENLLILDLSNNNLVGFENPVMLLPWNHLKLLHLQGNRLQGSLPTPPSSMEAYVISNNQLVGGISNQFCQATSMKFLDIGNNNLSGQIPRCLSELSTSLYALNLENNKFHGTIPLTYPKSCSLKMINLSGNQLEGSLPRSLTNCIGLEVVDVGRNRINDTFPSWLGGLPDLHILVLRHNHFHGKIDGQKNGNDFRSLRIIDLSNNFLNGDLPVAYLQNWDAMKVVNESQSITSGSNVPLCVRWLGIVITSRTTYNYKITIANKGNDRQYTKVLTVLRVLDFSSNNFTGRIPNVIGELKGLQSVNLSNNNLEGEIPSSLTGLIDLESLDLSNNMLSGEIPSGLTDLTFLEVFNVSFNHLSGPIPQGRQFGTFDNSSFVGNLGLCGPQLSKKCGDSGVPSSVSPQRDENQDEEDDSKLIDWIIRGSGYLGGFAVGCALGKYITDRNHEWFVETFGRRTRTLRTKGRRAPTTTRRRS